MEQFCSGITIYVSLWWFVSDTLDDASLVVSDSPAQLMSNVTIVITIIAPEITLMGKSAHLVEFIIAPHHSGVHEYGTLELIEKILGN